MNRDLLAFCTSETIPLDTRTVFSNAKLLIENAEMSEAIDQLAIRIIVDFHERHPVILFNLRDAVWIFSMLTQRFFFPYTPGYCELEADQDFPETVWKMEPIVDVKDRDILFLIGELRNVDEIKRLNLWAEKQGALGVSVVTLVDQTDDVAHPHAFYSCLRPKAKKVFGCGLSYDGYGGGLPHIYAVSEV